MHSSEEKYPSLKESAREAKQNPDLYNEVLSEIVQFAVAELRSLGLSDGALCAWAELEGFEAYASELAKSRTDDRYRALNDRVWALFRRAGAVDKSPGTKRRRVSWTISSETLRHAKQSVVLHATKEFRSAVNTVATGSNGLTSKRSFNERA